MKTPRGSGELELRHFEVEHFDIRGHGDERTVRGLAVPFDKKSLDLGGFQEVIRHGAATESLRGGDIAMLWQHDHTQPISRQSATRNALVLEERKSGVFFEQPADSLTEFQLDKLNDGVVRHMSFGFRVSNEEGSEVWTEGGKGPALREILRMDLREISPVTFPAYQSTKLAVRSAKAAGIVLGGFGGAEPDAAVRREHDHRRLDLVAARMGLKPDLDAAAEHVRNRKRLDALTQRIAKEPPPVSRRREREYPSASAWRQILLDDLGKVRAIAHHEASHAVYCVLAGIRLDLVYLHSTKRGYDGRWQITGGRCNWRDVQRGDPRVSAELYMSGPAGEQLVGYDRRSLQGPTNDKRHAEKLTMSRGTWEDLENAKPLLRRHWGAVGALAELLVQEQRVSGETAEAIILENLDSMTRQRLSSGMWVA